MFLFQESINYTTRKEGGSVMKNLPNRRDAFPAFFNSLWRSGFFNEGDMPAVNVKENKKSFKLEVSSPGFDKEDFDINVDKNIITISAKKEESSEAKDIDDRLIRQEFTSAAFSRSFTLPENIDTSKITAEHKNGILEISLPKMENALEDKVKKIEIK